MITEAAFVIGHLLDRAGPAPAGRTSVASPAPLGSSRGECLSLVSPLVHEDAGCGFVTSPGSEQKSGCQSPQGKRPVAVSVPVTVVL